MLGPYAAPRPRDRLLPKIRAWEGTIISKDHDVPASAEGTGRAPAALQSAMMLYTLADDSAAGISVRGAADAIGVSRSAAHRILQALAADGFAVQDRQGRYSVGPRLVQLAALVLSESSFLGTTDEVMVRLVGEVGETAYLAMFVPSENYATFVHRVECTKPLRYVQPIGARIPLHAGAVGKAILAHLDTFDIDAQELPRYTDNTLSPLQLREDLRRIRDRGYATSIEERVEGAAGVAAPVWSRGGVAGALTINVPTSRLPADGIESLGPLVVSYAKELSAVITASGTARF